VASGIESLQEYVRFTARRFLSKPDGTPDLSRLGIEQQWIASGTLRLSSQMNTKDEVLRHLRPEHQAQGARADRSGL
jgi:hypothetical protein